VPRTIRLLVVDSEPIVYMGLAAVLRQARDIRIAGFVREGKAAIERVCSRPPPGGDIVVVEPVLPHDNGAALIGAMKRGSPATRVLVYSRDHSQEAIRGAFAAGASSYASKDSDPALLPVIIRKTALGQPCLCAPPAAMIAEELAAPATASKSRHLTPQEMRVLQHVVQGRTSKEIASALGVSKRTIDAHRASIMARLDIHTVPGLAIYAVSAGLVPPRPLRIPT
jgi:DNA-binding NarL/FixJ family response regulator